MKWLKKLLCKHKYTDPIIDMRAHKYVSECLICGKKKYITFNNDR